MKNEASKLCTIKPLFLFSDAVTVSAECVEPMPFSAHSQSTTSTMTWKNDAMLYSIFHMPTRNYMFEAPKYTTLEL